VPSGLEVRPVTPELVRDAEQVFAANPDSAGCYCMWFLIPVAQYHAGGHDENRRLFRDLAERSSTPVGLLAYADGEPVAWCAAGPRSRFVRALKVPSFRGRDPVEDDTVWFVPCFNVPKDWRRRGVSTALLNGAVELARRHGAAAIEGFPFARGAKLSRESMVGVQATFEACGFAETRRPSATRVVMRRDLDR
jgi:GNAT superfamily N-acetyltransferase